MNQHAIKLNYGKLILFVLTQVVLNILRNALDAVADVPEGNYVLQVTWGRRVYTWDVEVKAGVVNFVDMQIGAKQGS